jgi:hypothetical protein
MPLWSRAVLPVRLRRRARQSLQLFKTAEERPSLADYSGSRVLIASSTLGNVDIASLDICLGIRLQKQGARVSFLVCDGGLSACSLCEKERFIGTIEFARTGPGHTCGYCRGTLQHYIRDFFQVFTYAKLDPEQLFTGGPWLHRFLQGKEDEFRGVPVREHVRSGLIRFYGRVIDFADVPSEIIRRFAEAACQTVLQVEAILKEFSPDVVVVNHGLYVPQGVIVATARAHGVRVVTWHKGYRRNTLLLSHSDTYHRQLIEEENTIWDYRDLGDREVNWLTSYMKARRTGGQDWISFAHQGAESRAFKLPHDRHGPLVAVLTNVDWDAQAHFSANTYPDMHSWLQDVLRCVAQLPEINFVVRVHPAEVTGRRLATTSSADVLREGAKRFPNLFIIEANDPMSTYQLIESSDLVVVYATKTAVEAAYLGKRVLICGESCLRGKGVGRDFSQGEDLPKVVEEMVMTPAPDCRKRAAQYAFHLFGRRMIEWELLSGSQGGKGEKAILDGIVLGEPFHAISDC